MRLIDADALVEALKPAESVGGALAKAAASCIAEINAQPTIEYVPVFRHDTASDMSTHSKVVDALLYYMDLTQKAASVLGQVKRDRDGLKAALDAARNELCLWCGKYTDAHNGACDWCRWRGET